MPRSLISMFQERTLILGTTTIFALAAALAVQFVEPRYRASAAVDLDEPLGLEASDNRQERVSRTLADASFRKGVRSDLGRPDIALGDASLSVERVLALVDWRSTDNGPIPQTVEAHVDPSGRHIDVFATAESPELARHLAQAAAHRLVASPDVVPERGEPPSPEDPAPETGAAELATAIAEARVRLASAETELTAFQAEGQREEPSSAGSIRPRADVERELTELRDAISGKDKAIEALTTLVNSPATASLDEASATPHLRQLQRERQTLGNAVEGLRLTLLDGHPRLRIARLRLEQVEADLAAEARTVLAAASAERTALGEREAGLAGELQRLGEVEDRQASHQARLAELELAVAGEARSLDDLLAQEVARREADAARSHDSGPSLLPTISVSDTDGIEIIRPRTLPAALAGGVAGFVTASLAVILRDRLAGAGRRRRRGFGDGARQRVGSLPSASEPPPSPSGDEQGSSPRDEIASRDEIVAAILESRVRRILVSGWPTTTGRALSVDIARRLTLQSGAILLVDLTEDRRALQAMGAKARMAAHLASVPAAAPLNAAAMRDFATDAEIIAGWPAFAPRADRRVADIRPALQAAERAYDFVVLDCGLMDAADIEALTSEDSGLLVAVDEVAMADLDQRLEALAAAGLTDVLLVSGGVGRPV